MQFFQGSISRNRTRHWRVLLFKRGLVEDFAATMSIIAQARIRRFERAAKRHYDEIQREARRTNVDVPRSHFPKPTAWSFRKDFNPFIVKSRANVYAHGISKSL